MDRTASAGTAGTAKSTVPERTHREPPSGQNASLAPRNRRNGVQREAGSYEEWPPAIPIAPLQPPAIPIAPLYSGAAAVRYYLALSIR